MKENYPNYAMADSFPILFNSSFIDYAKYFRHWILRTVTHKNIGLVHKIVRVLTLPYNFCFAQITKQSINYVLFSITHDCLPTFGQVFYLTLEEIRRFGREEFAEPILELSVVVEVNSAQIVGEREQKRW
jgi:hypothetical protein